MLLGRNIIGKTDTISPAIYNATFDGDIKKAAILSIILIIISVIFYIFTYLFKIRK
ncbi:transcriptional regulator, Fis family [Campylobacter hominis ATCC BAA-381]|uniref:Transcriptional regulator, Fis family n=1 Tax=Campylobacter hominis (strain ATCC BAA-381 / DSM 21671 / CCUG 45161 / LMG 19568 / NCTC 13146 / CH001A) TaxID=360107 RepID=A7I346_CAMHC|nr:transcriptional regulator, Fis family [Campylobacter hominis ATCC BAA-381]